VGSRIVFWQRGDDAIYQWRLAFIQNVSGARYSRPWGRVCTAETLRRFWTMLSHAQGTLLNHSTLASSLGISGQTITRYLDLLVDLLLVRRLQPLEWKHSQASDSQSQGPMSVNLASCMPSWDYGRRMMVLGHPVAGAQLGRASPSKIFSPLCPSETEPCFYRTSAGAEIDLVLEMGQKERWAVEIKRSSTPSVSRGFHTGCADLKATRRIVVYPGEEAFSPRAKTSKPWTSIMPSRNCTNSRAKYTRKS